MNENHIINNIRKYQRILLCNNSESKIHIKIPKKSYDNS